MREKTYSIIICYLNEKMTFKLSERQKESFVDWLKGYDSELFELIYEDGTYYFNRINIGYVKIAAEKIMPLGANVRY